MNQPTITLVKELQAPLRISETRNSSSEGSGYTLLLFVIPSSFVVYIRSCTASSLILLSSSIVPSVTGRHLPNLSFK